MNRQTKMTWDEIIACLPGAHVLQTTEWAEIKARVGWRSQPLTWMDGDGNPSATAMLLERCMQFRGLSLPVRVLYVPKGPNLAWGDDHLRGLVLDDLQRRARKMHAIFIKIDPDVIVGRGIPGEDDEYLDPTGKAVTADLKSRGWIFSPDQIQFRNTMLIDLELSEDELLARMKQKTRYNLRLAERKGVSVRVAGQDDLPLLYQMYAETSVRDGFVIRDQAYYQTVWASFVRAGFAEGLIAEVESQPVAGVMIFRFGERAWYLYGMSTQAHRDKMPNVLLQWQAMRRAKAAGCKVYDLWGAPDEFDESDDMWGVFRFKEGLGAEVVRTVGAWDYPVNPWVYRLYTRTLPLILNWMRRRGKAQTRRTVQRSVD
jgi:lipid II:glycine glycyltransferase (peptidoglycan interpeptide bridge formation enzyme)